MKVVVWIRMLVYEDVDMETETDTADTESDEDISVPPHIGKNNEIFVTH